MPVTITEFSELTISQSLISLPLELLNAIFLWLQRQDLISLVRSCRKLRSIVLNYLGRSICLDLNNGNETHWLSEKPLGSEAHCFRGVGSPDQLATNVEALKHLGVHELTQRACLALNESALLTRSQDRESQDTQESSIIDQIISLTNGKSFKRLHLSVASIPTAIPHSLSCLTSLEIYSEQDFLTADYALDERTTDWQGLFEVFCIPSLETVIIISARCWAQDTCAGIGRPASGNVKNLIFLDGGPVPNPTPNTRNKDCGRDSHLLSIISSRCPEPSDFVIFLSWLKGLETFYYEVTPDNRDLFSDSGTAFRLPYFAESLKIHAQTLQRVSLTYYFTKEEPDPELVLQQFPALHTLDVAAIFFLQTCSDDRIITPSPTEVLPPNIQSLLLKLNHESWSSPSDRYLVQGGIKYEEPKMSYFAERVKGWLISILQHKSQFSDLRRVVLYKMDWGICERTMDWAPTEAKYLQETVQAFSAAGLELLLLGAREKPIIVPDPLEVVETFC